MTITLSAAAIEARRNAACNSDVDLLDVGSGTAKLRIRDGLNVLCEINLPNPAFGAAGASVIGRAGANGLPLVGTATQDGEADNFQAVDRDGVVVFEGSAGESAADCIVDEADIETGFTVTVLTWTHQQN
jgi:hypothetical protein